MPPHKLASARRFLKRRLDHPLKQFGEHYHWVGATEEKAQLYMRHLDGDRIHVVEGSEGGLAPFFSPDSQWLGFWADRKLKKVSIRGGVPQTIRDLDHLHGASWGDGVIVVEPIGDGELCRIDPTTGDPRTLKKQVSAFVKEKGLA